MIDTIEKFLIDYRLNTPDNTLLVGFSGGCDSLCLLDILNGLSQKYQFKLIALHLNHNWRGEESKQEENNCQTFCKKNNIKFVSKTLDADTKHTEHAARDARYAFFLEHAKKYPNSSIFTAHTKSDNAETIIYRIIKGTGISGLQGILPKRMLGETPLYRPLLTISRNEIEDYCNCKGLVPNTDSSNFDINYKRNFIRHKIMPLFAEINFHAEKSINNLASLAISQNNIVNEYIKKIMQEIYVDKKLLTEKFKNLSVDVKQRIIYDACLKFGLDYDLKKIKNILEFINDNHNSKSGSRYSLTNDLWLFVSYEYIYVITKTKADSSLDETIITQEGIYKLPDGKTFSLEKYPNEGQKIEFPKETDSIAYVNLSNTALNFTLRTRRDGDFITPFGMTGSMKLKKYLNTKKIPQHEKDGILLLCQGSEVLWAIGVGLSNKLKVENTPTHLLFCRKVLLTIVD